MSKISLLILYFLLATLLQAKSAISLPTSFKASFKQTITTDKKKKINYSGTLLFSSPKHFKWSYNAPTKKEVCTDGKELLIVDHDLEQISAYYIDSALNLSEILKKAKFHRKSVYIAKHRDKNYTIQVNSRGQLSRIAYLDDLDNTVLIIFSKMRYSSKKINQSKLKCNYPADYDEIRQ